MILHLSDGSTKQIRPFSPVHGLRIVAVIITAGDLRGLDWDKINEWLKEAIYTRYVI